MSSLLLDRAVAFFKRTDGRDKSLRVIQYCCILSLAVIREHRAISSKQKYVVDSISRVSRAMSTSRKALKLARMLEDLQTLRNVAKSMFSIESTKVNGKTIIVLCLKALSAVYEILYYYYDHVVWFFRNDLVKSSQNYSAARASWLSSVFWLANAFVDAVVDSIEYYDAKCECTQKSTKESKVSGCGLKCKIHLRMPLLKIWMDVLTALGETEYLAIPLNGNALIEGSCGLIASILGWQSVWKVVCSSIQAPPRPRIHSE
mmetsp:Transcript_1770/g.3172  ORF Transcript_1770/g.3172 Transcript_1770/m.3172 type:complete len:260 (-) Transcript_1770:215-994(-)